MCIKFHAYYSATFVDIDKVLELFDTPSYIHNKYESSFTCSVLCGAIMNSPLPGSIRILNVMKRADHAFL